MDATTTSRPDTGLSYRAIAMLRAVDTGAAELTCSCEPDLFIDGVPCCDQFTAHMLAHRGFIRPARLAAVGSRVPAVLTPAGHDVVGTMPAAA